MPRFHRRAALLATLLVAPAAPLAAQEQPITIDREFVAPPLQINGFGVFDFTHDDTAKRDSADAEKLALSVYKPFLETFYAFGQATIVNGGEGDFESEIDNLIVSFTPAGLSHLNLTAGRFDAPVGFERDDEPLNLQSSNSFNFAFGRPAKFDGVILRESFNEHLDLAAYVVNGWEETGDNNTGKTIGVRLGLTPVERHNVGLSVVYGPEKDDNNEDKRLLLDLDYTLQITPRWLLAGEGNLGSEENSGPGGRRGRWIGGQLTSWVRLNRTWAILARAEVLDDEDGVLTGAPRTLRSYTLGADLRFSQASYGVFSAVEHTQIRIPQFGLRAEIRRDQATEAFFDAGAGEPPARYRTVATAQLFFVF